MTEEEKMAVNCSFENHRKAMIRAGQDIRHITKLSQVKAHLHNLT